MIISELHLKNFRNYTDLSLNFHPNLNIFVGQNAQGKTNVAESIYFLALTRSHRTHADRELIAWDSKEMTVAGTIIKKNTTVPLEILLNTKGRIVKANHLKEKRLADYIGNLNVIMFAPEDLAIIKGAPSVRRRFIDMEIGQIRPVYLYDLMRYHKTLKERNAYLKFDKTKLDANFLDVLDEQLVEYGEKVISHRQGFIDNLTKISTDLHDKLSQGKEKLDIIYACNVKQDFAAELKSARQKDLFRMQTSVGPHRDDLQFLLNNIDVSNFGSQGQQRTTALSVKLAEIDLIFQETGDYPVLLLDDVMSELDNQRQLDLLSLVIGKTQTFITTTTLDHLQNLPDKMAVFEVKSGEILEKNRD
ncbi:DNA replication and repair protein RecF [Lactococcus hodotermopsidis]|uniref:DNA replication and repair protein RecF n=1 Tax=Pseudolactococcus hodotermopsidis TaxID=2709157 RepID=A0A6A0BFZ8_9LACT|nr:DNA replication/repair protein RecF [Lactococcus hodotermopsidis]GFH42767.1 DNA replication and repair protein RecF [Lactococcus hodotermopsidis]